MHFILCICSNFFVYRCACSEKVWYHITGVFLDVWFSMRQSSFWSWSFWQLLLDLYLVWFTISYWTDLPQNNVCKSCKFINKIMFDFHKKILFSDEAHFWLNGYVNKQNCQIWGDDNPQAVVETPLQPQKLLFGVLFGQRKSLVYISSKMMPAACWCGRPLVDTRINATQLFEENLGVCFILYYVVVSKIVWFNTAEVFFVAFVKSLVHADKFETIEDLEKYIQRVVANILSS